jgi:sec-independent protein translocase protein TatA
MGNIGMGELIVILVIVLVIFGAGKLAQVGDALGKGIANFRKASKEGLEESKEAAPAKKDEVAPREQAKEETKE